MKILKWIAVGIVFFVISAYLFGDPEQQKATSSAVAESPIEQSMEAKPELEKIHVPSDSRAKYFLMGITRHSSGDLEIQTKRIGPSGTSYSIRRVKCSPLRFGYIADSDDVAGLSRRDENPRMSELVSGSISDVISRYACTKGKGL